MARPIRGVTIIAVANEKKITSDNFGFDTTQSSTYEITAAPGLEVCSTFVGFEEHERFSFPLLKSTGKFSDGGGQGQHGVSFATEAAWARAMRLMITSVEINLPEGCDRKCSEMKSTYLRICVDVAEDAFRRISVAQRVWTSN